MDDQLLEREPRHLSPGANDHQQPASAPARLPRLAHRKSSPAALSVVTPAEPNVKRPILTHEGQQEESRGAALALEGGWRKILDSTRCSYPMRIGGARRSNQCCEEVVASQAAPDTIIRPGTCDLHILQVRYSYSSFFNDVLSIAMISVTIIYFVSYKCYDITFHTYLVAAGLLPRTVSSIPTCLSTGMTDYKRPVYEKEHHCSCCRLCEFE